MDGRRAKISSKKLADALGLSQTAIEKNISFLKANGYLRRQGSARGGYWEVRR
ncbi:HTH domain-containing protein [bacterium]|nr:HTH domain-containing protein [bacterium]